LQLSTYQNFLTAKAERWLVVRSVSKFLGPDLRVAVCSGDEGTLGRIERAQSYSMGWVSSMLQNLAGTLLHDTRVRTLITRAGATYTARYRAMQNGLRQLNLVSTGSTGLNLWLPCVNEGQVSQYLLAQGWKIRSGADFIINTAPGFRLTSASLTDDTRVEFLEALGESLKNRDAMTA
jgi:DNA-binding transcriptional MocR family regulator